jgi:hypothetical protein
MRKSIPLALLLLASVAVADDSAVARQYLHVRSDNAAV